MLGGGGGRVSARLLRTYSFPAKPNSEVVHPSLHPPLCCREGFVVNVFRLYSRYVTMSSRGFYRKLFNLLHMTVRWIKFNVIILLLLRFQAIRVIHPATSLGLILRNSKPLPATNRARILRFLRKPRNRFQGIYSASLCSLAVPYDNPIPISRFLDCLEIPALWQWKGLFDEKTVQYLKLKTF